MNDLPDLVQRLRRLAEVMPYEGEVQCLKSAADVIDSLVAELAAAREALAATRTALPMLERRITGAARMLTTPPIRCPNCGSSCTLFVRDVCAGCFRASQEKVPEARIVAGPEANDPSAEEIEAAKEWSGGVMTEARARIRLRHDKEHSVTLPCGRLLVISPERKNGRFTIEIRTANGGAIVVTTLPRHAKG